MRKLINGVLTGAGIIFANLIHSQTVSFQPDPPGHLVKPGATEATNRAAFGAMDNEDFKDDRGDSFSPALGFFTNNLWLQIPNVANGLVYLNLNKATNQVYEIWSKTDLKLTNWNIEMEVLPTNHAVMPFVVLQSSRTNLFIWARDWTGIVSHGNTTPEWWFYYYYGRIDLSDTNRDSLGHTLASDYQFGLNPNVIEFNLTLPLEPIISSPVNGTIDLVMGTPSSITVLVNDTNQAHAVWQPYTSNLVANLNSGNGAYNVLAGLRGSANAPPAWQSARVTLLSVPLILTITNPAISSTVSRPMIQVQGFANETLSRVTYDVSNATGIFTNQTGCLTGQFYDTNLLTYTTNYFQCYDVPLGTGLNIIKVHGTNASGGTATTSVSVTLNYSGDHTAPVLSVIWPTNRTSIAGSNFTVQAQIDDATATVTAAINSNTLAGVVERSGTVWFNNLPLNSGTNIVTITATDAAGNMSTTNLNVIKSSVSLTINPLSSGQLNQPVVMVTGTIGDSSDRLTVNGIAASVSGNNWTANNVPVSPSGTAGLNVRVTDSGNNPLAAQSLYQAQPSQVLVTSYEENATATADFVYCYEPDPGSLNRTVSWTLGVGGHITQHSENFDRGPCDAYADLATNWNSITMNGISCHGNYSETLNPAWQYGSVQQSYTLNLGNGDCAGYNFRHSNLTRTVDTKIEVLAGKQSRNTAQQLVLLKASAAEYSTLDVQTFGAGQAWFPDTNIDGGGDIPLPASAMLILGQTLTPTTTNANVGETVISVPAGGTRDITPSISYPLNQNHYSFNAQAYDLDLQLSVDANRDGNVTFDGTDQTIAAQPFRFWVNNDYDAYDGSIADFDDLDPSTGDDANNTSISCTRDLEDYTRLRINTQGLTEDLQNGNLFLALQWKNVIGNPGIRIFQAVEAGGGSLYLTDANTAQAQITAPYGNCLVDHFVGQTACSGSFPFIFPTNTWANLSSDQPVANLLFDAVGWGRGQLVITIYKNDTVTELAEGQPLYMKLQDVKEMYERYSVGENPNFSPATTASLVTSPYAYDSTIPAENNYILFVHGWNLATWEKDAFAETAFKRLYWQGYKGRFGSFRWPTGYGFTGWKSVVTDPDNYDNSEFNAWFSGTGLKNLLAALNSSYSGHVYLMAHSMGNVAAGEALRLAGSSQLVNTYIAMQGAVPAHAYDQIADFRSITLLLESGTPDRYANYPTNNGPCYFNGIAGARTYVNFFNADDWALEADHWQLDEDLKPDTGFSYSGANFYAGGTEISFPSSAYEIFAYCDEARCFALGAQASVGGVFTGNQVNLFASPFDFGNLHKDHSGEFNSDNMNRSVFWRQFLLSIKLIGAQ